jgi:hypothetical protein
MVNDDIDSEHGSDNLDKSGAGDTTVQRKASAQTAIKYKNVTLKDSEPARLHHAVGQKPKGPKVSTNCVTPLQFFMEFFTSTMVKKVTAETCQCHRRNCE